MRHTHTHKTSVSQRGEGRTHTEHLFVSRGWGDGGAFAYQQAAKPEAPVVVGDSVLAVEAALALAHRFHRHARLCVAAQRLHHAVATTKVKG